MTGKVQGQLLKGARCFQGNSLKIYRNRGIKPQEGKQKRNPSESGAGKSSWFHGTAKRQPTVTTVKIHCSDQSHGKKCLYSP